LFDLSVGTPLASGRPELIAELAGEFTIAADWGIEMRWSTVGAALAIVSLSAANANAAQIDFTGGTATFTNATTATTNNSVTHSLIDFYEENGFRLDFIGDWGYVGNYYGVGNDVIHGHWDGGCCGQLTAIEITKIGGGTFDLNYFILTSNTMVGGGPANGTEQVFIQGFLSNVATGAAQLLPSENWGFPATQIFLGSAFDAVDMVRFTSTNNVSCFGMDEFFIDEQAPGTVPEPATLFLAGSGLALLARRRMKGKKSA
jgi:hypothetical protein